MAYVMAQIPIADTVCDGGSMARTQALYLRNRNLMCGGASARSRQARRGCRYLNAAATPQKPPYWMSQADLLERAFSCYWTLEEISKGYQVQLVGALLWLPSVDTGLANQAMVDKTEKEVSVSFLAMTVFAKTSKKVPSCGGVVTHVKIRRPTVKSGKANWFQKAAVQNAISSKSAIFGASPRQLSGVFGLAATVCVNPSTVRIVIDVALFIRISTLPEKLMNAFVAFKSSLARSDLYCRCSRGTLQQGRELKGRLENALK